MDIGTHMTDYCAVISPALSNATQQAAVKKQPDPLLSLAEWGVAMQD